MRMTRLPPAALALLPFATLADTCPWLGADVASQVILAAPAESKVEKNPVFANAQGLAASTTCRFKEAGELVGQLSVIVMEYTTYDTATTASWAVKGKRLVFVHHVLGKRVKEAMRKDPDGAVLSTHEVTRHVLEKL